MSEAALWRVLKDELAIFGSLRRIENSADKGTPDVAYCLRVPSWPRPTSGWCELKHMDAWPAREITPLTLPELTLDQVLWHESWARAGGAVCLILRVGKGSRAEFLRLDPALVKSAYERRLTKGSLRSVCANRGHRTVGKDRGAWLRWLADSR
jgi:hypothetical protein